MTRTLTEAMSIYPTLVEGLNTKLKDSLLFTLNAKFDGMGLVLTNPRDKKS